MGHHHVSIPVEVALLLVGAAAAGAQEKGTLPDVLIQAEEKRPVQREKPALNMDVKADGPIESALKTEPELKTKQPSEIDQMSRFTPGVSQSANAALPSGQSIIRAWKGEPARVFYPARELKQIYDETSREAKAKARWEYVVADASGGIFRKFGGQGLPPDELVFDGKSEDGKWIRVGQVYTGVLTYFDAAGKSHTAMGRPFAIPGLSLQRQNGYVINLAPKAVLGPGKGSELPPYGAALLKEAAQLIRRFHAGLSVEVAAYLSKAEGVSAQGAADACAKELAKGLLAPPGSVTAHGHPGADLEERIELSILNR